MLDSEKKTIFAVGNRENGLHLSIEQTLCIRFAPSLQSESAFVATMTKLELKVEMGEVRRARAFALSVADEAGLSERQAQNLHLVVEEAVANIVNYSGATMMELSAWQEDGSLYVSFTDDGIPFDPTLYPEPDLTLPVALRAVGGLGIHYIRKMSDGMAYRREEGKNILTVRKTIGK